MAPYFINGKLKINIKTISNVMTKPKKKKKKRTDIIEKLQITNIRAAIRFFFLDS